MHLTFLKNRLTIITGPEYPCPLNIFHKWYVKLRKTFIPPCVDLPAWEYIRTISKSCNIGSQFEQLDFSWWWGVCISWMCVSTYIKPYIEEQPCFRMPVFNFLDEGTCVYIDSPAGCTRLYETSLYEQQRTPTPWDGHCCWRDSEGGKKSFLIKTSPRCDSIIASRFAHSTACFSRVEWNSNLTSTLVHGLSCVTCMKGKTIKWEKKELYGECQNLSGRYTLFN